MISPTRNAGGLALLLLLVGVAGHAQQPAPQRAERTLNEGVTAVLVDVVVRDKRGQPVRDLKSADFEVFEDGVPQPIGSFTPVFRGGTDAAPGTSAPPVAAGSGATGGAAESIRVNFGPSVTALVFFKLCARGHPGG